MPPLLALTLAFAQTATACLRERHDVDLTEAQLASLNLAPRQAAPFPPVWTAEEKLLHNSFSTKEIDTWSSYYTHGNHIAGLNRSIAEETARKWTENGVPAELVEYEVFLSYPKEQKLVLNWGNGSSYEAQMYEDVLKEDETTGFAGAPPGFHGYSKSGRVEGEYVYVGRGHKDDFAALKKANVSLAGKIALAKYGGPFRGVKVQNAEANGMIGVVIFTDPGDDGPQEKNGQKPYPYGPARQPSSLQRGSVAYINQYPGDPTTPGQPSFPGAPRVSPSNLPSIPSLPLSYRDAIPLLRALDGHGVSAQTLNRGGWTGGLNASYSTGPAPGVTLSLVNEMEEKVTPIWNVIGTINGTNTDETVMIGNHRDAWIVGGAADPNSGSAVMVEIARAFGGLLKTGWKPRRNIVLASWDAEEYALIGSTEHMEAHQSLLSSTLLTYLNIDIGVTGALPSAGSTPELRTLALDVMKQVTFPNPSTTTNTSTSTLYDAWHTLNQFRPEDNGFTNLGSGSDYTAFLQLGAAALDFGLDADRNSSVYHYHSQYDSYHWMTTRIDPDFGLHATAGRFLALLAYRLASDALVPFDMGTWARNVNYYVRDLVSLTMDVDPDYGAVQARINISALDAAAKRLQNVAYDFADVVSTPEFLANADRVAKANRAMMAIGRVFVREGGLPGRAFYRNVLVAPNRDDGYKAQTLPWSTPALQDRKWDECRAANVWLAGAMDRASALLEAV